MVGVPKTIDNDLAATDYTFGFDTAVMIATEAIDRLHTTAESHHRVLIVEVMGRHAGWIAWHSGVAGGANVILIPERPFHIDEVCAFIEHRFASHYAPIVVVAEGALPVEGTLPARSGEVDAFGHMRLTGIGTLLESEIAQRTGKEARATVLGHVQRGGTPDRLRPGAGHPVRAACGRRPAPRPDRPDGGPARHRHRPGAAVGGDGQAETGIARAVRRGRGVLRLIVFHGKSRGSLSVRYARRRLHSEAA